ncbi:MAG: aldo/keto reductase [Cytophaga sp.]|nr:aldo/keto reductase [Undibacterium sp.]
MRDPIQLSTLGFGCAPVMGKVGKSEALRAMSEAFNLGVTHFDVARSYGFGRAEQVVGSFIKGRRDKVTVTSKFGVVPPNLNLSTKALIPVARLATKLMPHLKARLKSKSGQLLAERNFDVAYARKCLDESLRMMKTDYIDIYLIHEPNVALLKNPEELGSLLEDSVRAGKIRRWGAAYQTVQDYQWASVLGGDVIQFEGNIETLSQCNAILNDERQRIVTRPFAGGLCTKPVLQAKLRDLQLTETVKELGASLADVSLCLAHELAGQSGTVLCSMFSSEHIQENTRTLREFGDKLCMKQVVSKIIQTTTMNNSKSIFNTQ